MQETKKKAPPQQVAVDIESLNDFLKSLPVEIVNDGVQLICRLRGKKDATPELLEQIKGDLEKKGYFGKSEPTERINIAADCIIIRSRLLAEAMFQRDNPPFSIKEPAEIERGVLSFSYQPAVDASVIAESQELVGNLERIAQNLKDDFSHLGVKVEVLTHSSEPWFGTIRLTGPKAAFDEIQKNAEAIRNTKHAREKKRKSELAELKNIQSDFSAIHRDNGEFSPVQSGSLTIHLKAANEKSANAHRDKLLASFKKKWPKESSDIFLNVSEHSSLGYDLTLTAPPHIVEAVTEVTANPGIKESSNSQSLSFAIEDKDHLRAMAISVQDDKQLQNFAKKLQISLQQRWPVYTNRIKVEMIKHPLSEPGDFRNFLLISAPRIVREELLATQTANINHFKEFPIPFDIIRVRNNEYLLRSSQKIENKETAQKLKKYIEHILQKIDVGYFSVNIQETSSQTPSQNGVSENSQAKEAFQIEITQSEAAASMETALAFLSPPSGGSKSFLTYAEQISHYSTDKKRISSRSNLLLTCEETAIKEVLSDPMVKLPDPLQTIILHYNFFSHPQETKAPSSPKVQSEPSPEPSAPSKTPTSPD